MAEEGSSRNPATLYKQCLTKYASNLHYNVHTLERANSIRSLPSVVLADIYLQMSSSEGLKDMLLEHLVDLETFDRLLKFSPSRQKLFCCVSSLMGSRKPFALVLETKYIQRYGINAYKKKHTGRSIYDILSPGEFNAHDLNFGMRLGTFLSEAGWISESITVFASITDHLVVYDQDYRSLLAQLDALQKLLHSEAVLCSFGRAEKTYNTIQELLQIIGSINVPFNLLANVYTQFSVLFFSRSEYDSSHQWSILALKQLNPNTPEKTTIDVLRQAAKACVVKREFKRANMLINQAVQRARFTFGEKHQKYADALLDYGFFLLNIDSVRQSVNVYNDALDIKRHIFGSRNFHVAIAHEDLSYAYYVHEYSSGEFQFARENVERAIDIMKDLVPSNHLMLASAKRVKALLLEEIALDKMVATNGNDDEGLLLQSEELHKFALKLSLEAFGEINVQTAKHYGNLGRLYQSMNRYEEAEIMHKKAIKIKTDLLGPFDYEVGLSIGHLASLYNYHMKKYREAEDLYLKSIDISLKLFGRTYSGLEYDYLGLCHIYEKLADIDKYMEYSNILDNWQTLREGNEWDQPVYPELRDDTSLEEVTRRFFEMCADPTLEEDEPSEADESSSSSAILQA